MSVAGSSSADSEFSKLIQDQLQEAQNKFNQGKDSYDQAIELYSAILDRLKEYQKQEKPQDLHNFQNTQNQICARLGLMYMSKDTPEADELALKYFGQYNTKELPPIHRWYLAILKWKKAWELNEIESRENISGIYSDATGQLLKSISLELSDEPHASLRQDLVSMIVDSDGCFTSYLVQKTQFNDFVGLLKKTQREKSVTKLIGHINRFENESLTPESIKIILSMFKENKNLWALGIPNVCFPILRELSTSTVTSFSMELPRTKTKANCECKEQCDCVTTKNFAKNIRTLLQNPKLKSLELTARVGTPLLGEQEFTDTFIDSLLTSKLHFIRLDLKKSKVPKFVGKLSFALHSALNPGKGKKPNLSLISFHIAAFNEWGSKTRDFLEGEASYINNAFAKIYKMNIGDAYFIQLLLLYTLSRKFSYDITANIMKFVDFGTSELTKAHQVSVRDNHTFHPVALPTPKKQSQRSSRSTKTQEPPNKKAKTGKKTQRNIIVETTKKPEKGSKKSSTQNKMEESFSQKEAKAVKLRFTEVSNFFKIAQRLISARIMSLFRENAELYKPEIEVLCSIFNIDPLNFASYTPSKLEPRFYASRDVQFLRSAAAKKLHEEEITFRSGASASTSMLENAMQTSSASNSSSANTQISQLLGRFGIFDPSQSSSNSMETDSVNASQPEPSIGVLHDNQSSNSMETNSASNASNQEPSTSMQENSNRDDRDDRDDFTKGLFL